MIPAHPDAQAVLEAARLRSDALVRGDIPFMRALLADDFIYTNASGAVFDKESYLSFYMESGTMRWTAQLLEETRVRLHADTAVLSCRVRDQATYEGHAFEGTFRSTQVWIRVNGAWRCAAIHTSEIT